MPNEIKRTFSTPTGTTISAEGERVKLERQPKRPELAGQPSPQVAKELGELKGTVDAKKWDEVKTKIEALATRLAEDPGSFSDGDRQAIAKALTEVAQAAEQADAWGTTANVLGWFPGLGIPHLVEALHTSDLEALAAMALTVKKRIAGAQATMAGDGDISGYMNLYVGNPLLATTGRLAQALGGDFVRMQDAVATYHYSASSTVKPEDFEATAGVLLVDKGTRQLVSDDGGTYCRFTLDNRPVFKAADGKLYFEPTDQRAPERVPTVDVGRVKKHAVASSQVGARARLPHDPDPRPNMKFTWHGWDHGELDVGWWGQCESSGMLGSMGLMPARQSVTLFDESSGKEVKLSGDEITQMMVFMGRGNYQSTYPATTAGRINRDRDHIDSDEPRAFHEFVMKQIERGYPFNLESHSYEQIWNYPVHGAKIMPTGKQERLGGGGRRQTYVMTLTKSNGSIVKYTYSLDFDGRDNLTASRWDMKACERANGKKNAVPDKMKSYFAPRQTAVTFSARSSSATRQGWTPGAIRLVSDLYFASHAEPQAGEYRTFAVRAADGKLLQMTRSEYDAYKAQHRGTGTGGP